jgi:zeaxanthin epoxidase
LGRLNSEAIKILTPLLPYRQFVDAVLSPLLPYVFRLQFWYCYSFCPVNIDAEESLELAKNMSKKYARETKLAWHELIKRT